MKKAGRGMSLAEPQDRIDTVADDGAHTIEGHSAGGRNPRRRLCAWRALPQACIESSRKAGPGEQVEEMGYFCPWLLMAFSPQLPTCFGAEIE
jgi:hypothetical protein